MSDDRERLTDGTIVNPDGSIIPPVDPDLMKRIEAAKDERGVVRDADLANGYHTALIRQSEEFDRLRGWVEPVIEQGSVFRLPQGEEVLLPYKDEDSATGRGR